MSGSNWRKDLEFGLIALACALLIALPISGLMLGEYAEIHRANAAYQQNAEKDRKAASEEISKTCFETDFSVFSKCITEKIAAYYEQQATNQDLQAQQDMAYWAKTLFFLGIFQLVFSAFGIYFIWHTLALNREAVGAAVEATKTTRDIGEDQSRAYVHADAAELSWGSSEKPYPSVVVTIANTGQTPARWFSVRAIVKVRDTEKPHQIDVAHGLTPKRWNGLGGNSSLTFPVIPDGDDFKSFSFAVNSRVDALGRIEYETFFGELFYSEFYFTLRPPHKMTFKPIKPTEEDLMAFKYRDEAPQKMARNEGAVATFVYLGKSTKSEP